MTAPDLKPVELITTSAELPALASRLGASPRLAVDTDSNSLFAYREQVCLIQFSSKDADFLVDPLAVQNLSSLKPVFERADIEKVFHAAEYDLICLRRDFGFGVNNLFDTMIAARILGRQAVGLSSLLEEEFGVCLDKKFQRANWGERPLSAQLLDYARLDTHYLIALRERLGAALEAKELTALAFEDFKRMAAFNSVDGTLVQVNHHPADPWRISGAYDLSPQQASVLQKLCEYRDETARQLDRPLFKVMSDQTLLAISQACPENLQDLGRLPGMSPGQIRRHGNELLRAVRGGIEAGSIYPPRNRRPDPAYSDRLETLRTWRKQTADKMSVQSDVVLPRDLMQSLASVNPRSQAELESALREVPWRLSHFGDEILQALNGKK